MSQYWEGAMVQASHTLCVEEDSVCGASSENARSLTQDFLFLAPAAWKVQRCEQQEQKVYSTAQFTSAENVGYPQTRAIHGC